MNVLVTIVLNTLYYSTIASKKLPSYFDTIIDKDCFKKLSTVPIVKQLKHADFMSTGGNMSVKFIW